jgi:pilus assembly protein CpaE
MPDAPFPGSGTQAEAGNRPGRLPLLCFASDAETEAALRQGLAEVGGGAGEFRRGDITAAIAALRTMPTPTTLVIDISGHPQPFAVLEDLSQVVEPGARVLVVGDRTDLGFYRHLTRGLGIVDYLYKPLTAPMVAEHFAVLIGAKRTPDVATRGGRLITITGARGGVGSTTIAAGLAWHLANEAKRHCLALDADLNRGTLALQLAAESGTGLRTALETPARVDDLFLDRSAHVTSERLHVLAAEEQIGQAVSCVPGAADKLLGVMRRRYNFVIADAPCWPNEFARELLDLAQQRVIVMEPTLACVRDTLRLMQLPPGAGQAHRPLIVLNRAGRPGALPMAKVTEAIKQEPDIVVPDLPKKLEEAATMGQPPDVRGFRNAIAKLAAACGATPAGPAPAAKTSLFRMFRK